MGKEDDSRVQIPPARSGRPSSTPRRLPPNALVRVEVRMPAVVAAQVFALAAANGRPVSATASDLLAAALAEREERHVT